MRHFLGFIEIKDIARLVVKNFRVFKLITRLVVKSFWNDYNHTEIGSFCSSQNYISTDKFR